MGFGEVLQTCREAAGLSQAELAKRAGLSLDSLRNWEQNRVLPKIDTVTRLARVMGISLDRLAYDPKTEDEAPSGPAKKKGNRKK